MVSTIVAKSVRQMFWKRDTDKCWIVGLTDDTPSTVPRTRNVNYSHDDGGEQLVKIAIGLSKRASIK